MITPKNIIDTLKDDYSCTLKEEKLLEMINSLELKLALEILKIKEVLSVTLKKGESEIILPFPERCVERVFLENTQIEPLSDYVIKNNKLIFDEFSSERKIKIEYIKIPEAFTMQNFGQRPLVLGEENREIYIFHLLSREALICEDMDRLNNYSRLYAESLKNLLSKKTPTSKFKNIW